MSNAAGPSRQIRRRREDGRVVVVIIPPEGHGDVWRGGSR